MGDNMSPEGLELVRLVDKKVDGIADGFDRLRDGMGERFDRLSETLSSFAKTNSDDHTALSERVSRLEDPPISLVRKRLELAKTVFLWGMVLAVAAKELLPDNFKTLVQHFIFQS